MGEEWFKKCRPLEYYEQFIQEGIYPDGRSISSFTPLSFKLGAWGGVGSALIRQGGVAVSCSVQGSLALTHDGPLITPEIEACESVSQMEINDIADLLTRLFTNKAIFPRAAFTIKGTEDTIPMTWELALRIQILNSDGCVPDAVVCATSAALSNVQLPAVKLSHAKDDEAPIQREEIVVLEEKSPLELTNIPIAITFHIFRSSKMDKVLVDPPQELAKECAAKVSMVVDGKSILFLRTRGVIKDEQFLSTMVALAERRHQSIMDVIRDKSNQ
ncbi:hypothetical protein OESDEN_12431 [Oesophagostomum dentatum]|uniref:Ribosomal RNA-processing protein 43 n=1 Tax=Oesophagostomum dentatum TaxID=61180 RepID=A0A0B1SV65_OESDE|nr:hypothetical protein OESDEN_12431 [Oesophagostomum dentatum]